MKIATDYDKAELLRRVESKAFQYTYYLGLSAIFLWSVWLLFDYYNAKEIFRELLVVRTLLSIGAATVVYVMHSKRINCLQAQLLLYIPALTFLGFLFNITPEDIMFVYILSGIFMVIAAGFIFFIMPPFWAIFYGVYAVFSVFFFQIIIGTHSILEILLGGGILYFSITAFTVAYALVRYKSIVKNYANELLIEATNRALEHQQHALRIKNQELERSLEEKVVLLKEIHHRVKNNLQIVSSLLNLQAVNVDGRTVEDVLISSQNRIHAMSILHEILYKSESLKSINLEVYFSILTDQLYKLLNSQKKSITITQDVKAENMEIDKLIPLGLIVNELVTNSIKHAFARQTKGNILIKFWEDKQGHNLSITDDGMGLPDDFIETKGRSLGIRLVYGLANQLNGHVFVNSLEVGTCIHIVFNDKKNGR
jgi:two-component sensor histidine kinase